MSVLEVRWGLVPSYAKKLNQGPMLINARVETVATKSPFAKLLARPERRCLVLADGWYEWLKAERKGADRIPFRYTVDAGEPFAFAGLWNRRRVGGEREPKRGVVGLPGEERVAGHERRSGALVDSTQSDEGGGGGGGDGDRHRVGVGGTEVVGDQKLERQRVATGHGGGGERPV